MSKSISVVIPNYNGKELLKRNISSVYNALLSSGISDFEIIISDDASKDDSVSFIKTNYPDIILVENQTNKGFAGNTNMGIFRAGKDLVLILNSDIFLTEGYFTNLLHYFDKPDTFGVMGRINAIDSDQIQDGAKYPGFFLSKIVTSQNYTCETKPQLYSFFLSGANALVDRKKLFEIGGFDELFNPYNSEDVNLGIKAWRLGYPCYYEHSAICKHPNSSTIKKEPSKKVKIISKRNKMYLHFIHLNDFELFYYFVILIGKTMFRAIALDFSYLKSVQLFMSSIGKCKEQKDDFLALQKKKGLDTSVSDVIDFIHKDIGDTKIVKF